MSSGSGKVPVACPSCDKRLLVPAGSMGKQGRCPVCQTVFTLEQLFEAESVPADEPNRLEALAPASNTWNTPGTSQSAGSSDDFQLSSIPQSSYATLTNSYAAPQVSDASPYQAYPAAEPVKRHFWDSFAGGLLTMAIAVIWFFGAAMFGVYFIYPPIMFIIGLVVAIKGLVTGNLTGR